MAAAAWVSALTMDSSLAPVSAAWLLAAWLSAALLLDAWLWAA